MEILLIKIIYVIGFGLIVSSIYNTVKIRRRKEKNQWGEMLDSLHDGDDTGTRL